MFIILKIKEKDKSVSFRSQSKYYPVFYIACQMTSVMIATCTYFTTQYGLYAMALPMLVALFFYIKLAPYGKCASFVNIAGLCIQCVPIIGVGMFAVADFINMSMFATIAAFCILSLYLLGLGVSVARLIIRYREVRSRNYEKNESDKVKVEE